MKTRIWSLGLVLMMALLVGASATTAEAAVSFTYTFDGCTGDTVCVTPTLNVVPDSVRWFYRGGALAVRDVATPFDTCFVYASGTPGRDSLVMTAYYTPDPDSTFGRTIFSDYLAAVNDGVTVQENDSILINVLVNDTTSTPDSNVVIAPYLAIINGPFNGTVPPAVGNNAMVWYVPDPGYNGTDNFVYQVTNECGLIDTAVVSITIVSDGLIAFDSCTYYWIDVPCNCDDSANADGAVSIGDSLRVCAWIADQDLDEVTAGWPQVDLPGLAGTGLGMEENPVAADSGEFCWPGWEADSTVTWYEIGPGGLDVAPGFYEIYVRARSSSPPNSIAACTTIVTQAIDNNDPDIGSGQATWTLDETEAGTAGTMGSAGSFAVLGGSTVTNTGAATIVVGDVGVSPGSSITGFPPGQPIGGSLHAGDGVAAAAQTALTALYVDLAGRACGANLTSLDLGGMTLAPGVYCFNSSAQLTGTLTLDGQGDPNAEFVIQTGSTLTTASGAAVILIGGAQAKNVYWQIGSSATLGTGTAFKGNIVALASITLTTGATLDGRALARTGAVTLDNNSIAAPPEGGGGVDGTATTSDSMRFFIDLRNEPFEEICQVCVTTYGFPTTADTGALANVYCLTEIAGDNRWALVIEVPPGDLENTDGPFTAVFHYIDNACNEDSVTVQYNGPVDNSAPVCTGIEWIYEALTDLDSNNCISIGESVRIRIFDTVNTDDVTYYVDLHSDPVWRLGLGAAGSRVQLEDLGGGFWGIDWVVGPYPLANAIDTLADASVPVPWVWLHAVDDAGNPLAGCSTGDSLQLFWTETNPFIDEIDARAPEPVTTITCIEDTTEATDPGKRAVRIRFTWDTTSVGGSGSFQDIARFRMFYDKGTGVIDYADTLAGLSWADTLGGGGTDGLIRVNDSTWDWTTDGTVELSWCRSYLFTIWAIDSCGNYELTHPDSVLCPGQSPAPVVDLSCEAQDGLNICLEWTTDEASADSFCIFMASDGAFDTAVWVATVDFTSTGAVYTWCTDDAGLDLIEFRWYDFIVLTYDSCGGVQTDSVDFSGSEGFIAQCLADLAAPVVCIFQPATLSPLEDTTLYSCDRCTPFIGGDDPNGMWIYTRPCNDTSLDVRSIDTVLIRLADSAGSPGRWVPAGFSSQPGPNHWAIQIYCEDLNFLVREDDSVEVVQVMVISTDAAGRTSTREQVETCCGFFEFKWSAYYVDVFVNTVNGNVQTYQPYCNAHGFAVDGLNEVEICIEAGTAPFKIRMAAAPSGEQWADEYWHQVVYVENVYARCTTLTFSSVGWEKGLGELDVEVCDAGGHYSDETEIALCVPDTIPPCALIVNPVDGKCIRRSRSMIDPVQICIEVDPLGNGLDNSNILKVDYQWSQECCVGFAFDTVCFDTACPLPPGFPDGQVCTTFANPNNPFFGTTRCVPTAGVASACTVYAATNNLDSTICWQVVDDTTCQITVCRLREVPCETLSPWETFAIQPGLDLEGDIGCVDWWNTEDLAWITQSGTIIYLRALVYDEQGNVCSTACMPVCVDIDETPLCLETPDICPSNGFWAIGGNEEHEVTFYANMDLDSSNVDDIEDVSLWFKKSTDPDLLDFWCEIGSGFFGENAVPGGTNSTVWRWDIDLDNTYGGDGCGFSTNTSYDFRVIVTSITGTTSHDANGDGNFDANTFDSSACDMNTYYVDTWVPQVAMDTVWTTVNGEPIVQPNVSCAMSDPRGWAWTQFGNEITVQPNVYPWVGPGPDYVNFRDDIKRVRWTLWDDSHTCECVDGREGLLPSQSCFDGDCDQGGDAVSGGNGFNPGWVVRDFQGGNPMQNLTFNPSEAPWFTPTLTGVQRAILLVEVWDSCGNRSEDCITIYMLDIDPTEAIIVEPMDGQVFCTGPGGDDFGGITIRSAAILEEGWNKAVYAYRAVGSTEWIEFDSVGVSADPDQTWQTFWNQVVWNPQAMGLADGAYELTVWAVDNALNRSTNLYTITVYLSCAPPTVVVTHPSVGDPTFLGCDIELEAAASSPDPFNPIERVDFYAVKVIDDFPEEEILIGSDFFSVDGRWGYHWTADQIRDDLSGEGDGPYYIFARATNRAGNTVQSVLIWVNVDITDPWASIAQVGDDLSNGGFSDPTIVEPGSSVDLWGYARDNQSPWGYGEANNCGVDSVIFYVTGYDTYEDVAGFPASVDPTVDSLYHAVWNTDGFPGGRYQVTMRVFDCACNEGSSDSWWVTIGSESELVVNGTTICGYTTVDELLEATVSVNDPDNVQNVYLGVSNTAHSDVYERYTWYSSYDSQDGTWYFSVDTQDWPDGVYRVRAIIQYDDGSYAEDFDGDGNFDDFSFNPELGHHELIRVDHGVTPFTVTPVGGETFRAHDDICFTFEATDTCDVASVSICSGDRIISPSQGDSLDFCFDPVDSSCITLGNCGVWSGSISVTVCDQLGHCEDGSVEVWILDVAGPDTALITSPAWGSFVTPSSNVVTARKLSDSGVDSVQFFYSTVQSGGTVNYIGSSVATGDEFSTEWDIEGIASGGYYLFARAFNNNTGKDGPRCVFVTVAQDCDTFTMEAPNPSFARTINGQTFTYVGEHVDLCVDRDGISPISNGVGIDSIVFCFRQADAPASTTPGNYDPNNGWVRIGADTYGSLCVDWFTDWCSLLEGPCCSDGRYAVVAWVYDKAGNVCHSIPLDIVIDISDPYSEIVDIDGDETFGTCHEVVLPSDIVVKFTANAIDDHSCLDLEPYQAWNSGAKYLQFFVGECGGGGGCVDIVFVQDGSGSMGDEQAAIASNAQLFANALGSVDFRLGVLGYNGNYDVMSTDGSRAAAAPGNGVFTTDISAFQTMITAVGTDMGGTENGLTALNQALTAYPFRANCNKVLILITDEDADDFADYATLFPTIVNSGAVVFGVIAFDDSAGYSHLGTATGGELFDITVNWGANLAALASQIQVLAGGGGNDVGIVWGSPTVTLTDGQDNAFALWNPTGLEPGEYCAWTVVIDNVGNSYTSSSRDICIVDNTPPVAHITGFGKSTDEHLVNKYTIYGATWDSDVDYVQFQYRPTGSNTETDWTGIGISSTVNGDSTCWMTTWNPCVLSGQFDLRVVPTDKNGNQDFGIQPIATVTLSNCVVTPSGASTSAATIWFEDRTFDDLGLVHVDQDNTSDDYHNMMVAVWADLTGDLTVEKIELWAPDPDVPSWKSGSFDGSDAIKLGGEGWFWQSYTDNNKRTHLKREVMTVWRVKAAIGACNSTHPTLGAKVCIEPGALSADNGIVVFPSRLPTLNLSQQHFQAWAAVNGTRFPLVTAIRLTDAVEGFNPGKYARITIKYADTTLVSSNLGVAWWDSDEWNATDGLIAGGKIDSNSATFHSDNLYGLYAVVSAGRVCNSGALTVENAGGELHVGNIFGPWPEIHTRVRSNIEFNNENRDIDFDDIVVVLDGNITLLANGDDADNNWVDIEWDEVTGILTTRWNFPLDCYFDPDTFDPDNDDENGGEFAPPLTPGTHTFYVQAFNKSGYCAENTYTFTVDATPPDVEVVGYEDCANPTFRIKITDEGGAGVLWENVFVDVFDITGSDFATIPKSRLIHTESYDAFNDADFDPLTGEFSFQLVSHIAQGRRLKIVIYNGNRNIFFDDENCDCEVITYDHECEGVLDRVGNNTQIVEEMYTIWGSSCSGGGGGDGDGIIIIVDGDGSSNPFDPWAGGVITFNLNGFDGGGVVTADVYDVAGVKVRNIFNGTITQTVGQVTWNGRNEDGERVAQGVYLVHFATTGGQTSGPNSQVIKVVVKRGSQASN